MPFKTSYSAALGMPAISLIGVDTLRGAAIGTVVRGFDDVQGEAEFIYLPGVANTAAGDMVVYDMLPSAPTTERTLAATHLNTGRPVAVAVAAVPANSFGWYQISGVAEVNAIAATAVGRAFLSATAGQVTSVAANGSQLLGARISSAVGVPSAGKSYLTLDGARVQGQVT